MAEEKKHKHKWIKKSAVEKPKKKSKSATEKIATMYQKKGY